MSLVAARPTLKQVPSLTALLAGCVLGLAALQIALLLAGTGGRFSYATDDVYIHLALTQRLAQGFYGLNPGEAAAPASSILYPFLLLPFTAIGLAGAAPLAIGIPATLASAGLLGALVAEAVEPVRLSLAARILVALGLGLGLDFVGLLLGGLEHSLHVALTLACCLGLFRFLARGRIDGWFWAAALAEPFVRYEGASVWLGVILILAWRGRGRAAAGLALCGAAGLGLFSVYLHQRGLGWLPSSVLAKTELPVDTGAASGLAAASLRLAAQLWTNMSAPAGWSLVLLAALVLAALVAIRVSDPLERERRRLIAGFALLVLGAHLLAGRTQIVRYDVYADAVGLVVLLRLCGPLLQSSLEPQGLARLVILALVPCAFMPLHPGDSLLAYQAMTNITGQQAEMHRFVTGFWRAPAGVNDLGWVSYSNPDYVLDFWGLGSEEARRAHRDDPSGAWMERLARAHGVDLAMIFDSWFDTIPATWTKVAVLSLDGPVRSGSERDVSLYATRPEAVARLRAALDAYAPTVPAGTRLTRTTSVDGVAAMR